MRIKLAGRADEGFVFADGRILEVQTDRETVFADTAIRGHDLDEAKAGQARKGAEGALANCSADIEYGNAQAKLAAAMAQIAAIKTLRRK